MKKIILLTLILIASSQISIAQQAIAKIKYEEAEEAFSTNDFKTTVLKLDEAETLLKATNPRIMYLKILAQSKIIEKAPLNDYKILENTRQLCAKYLLEYESIPNNEDKYRDVYKASEALTEYPETKAIFFSIKQLKKQANTYMYVKDSLDYAKALKIYTEIAELGDIQAKAELGRIYSNGFGVEIDYCKAASYFKETADKADAVGQNGLGTFYKNGYCVQSKDIAKAILLFELAAEQGNEEAIYNLGDIYTSHLNGLSGWVKIEVDPTKAINFIRLSAESGNAESQFYLAAIYDQGLYVPKNSTEAIKNFQYSADNGNSKAQLSVGYIYYSGLIANKDYVKAIKYFRLNYEKEKENSKAPDWLYHIYKEGGFGIIKDKEEAKMWLDIITIYYAKRGIKMIK